MCNYLLDPVPNASYLSSETGITDMIKYNSSEGIAVVQEGPCRAVLIKPTYIYISVKDLLLLKNHVFSCFISDCQIYRSDGHPIPSIRKGPGGPAEQQAEQQSAAYPCAEDG